MERYSGLTQEQLIAELMKAQARIEELETSPNQVSHPPIQKSNNDGDANVFPIHSDDDSSIFFENCLSMMNKNELKTPIYKNSPSVNRTKDDFIVAYKHKGTFPSCDQDLTISTDCGDGAAFDNDATFPNIIFENGAWENDLILTMEQEYEDTDPDEEFPLVPSPIMNTPPYEYIFLTRENEAKIRIFLNPKLNQVFQEELAKIKRQEGELDSEGGHHHHHHDDPDKNQDSSTKTDNVDWHNQNHLINCSSTTLSEIKATLSGTNVIHCFDPSDVDLELKKIFTEKPPMTHRIVRRKSRLERGSSVPAVDSYYGTSDLTKVGHASYFIPDLTEDERKAIGWKPDYHFGHWKYTTMTMPNIRTNPTPLHPHPHVEDEHSTTHSKHSHHHHSHHHHSHHHHHHPQDTLLMQNPLHQKEINLSYSILPEATENKSSVGDSPPSKHISTTPCKNPIHQQTSDDSLSYITLSGEFTTPSTQSCHLIRNKCALKKLLKWLLPCANTEGSSYNPSDYQFASNIELEGSSSPEGMKKTRPEIETLVEAPDKLTFPVSQTHISFAKMKPGQVLLDDNENSLTYTNQSSVGSSTTKRDKGQSRSHSHHQHHQHGDPHRLKESHKPHSHHHGIFHWKQMLHHGTTQKPLTVVGGDVLESNHGSATSSIPAPLETVTATIGFKEHVILGRGGKPDLIKPLEDDDSFTDDSEASPSGEKRLRRKQSKKLKPSKAFDKLLTLKDLGYQSDESNVEPFTHKVKANKERSRSLHQRKPKNSQDCVTPTSSDISSLANDCSTQIAKTYFNRKSQQKVTETAIGNYLTTGAGKKSRNKDGNSSDNTGDDGDDDFSSCGSNCPLSVSSPMTSSSQQNSIATTHFYYDDGPPNFNFNFTNSAIGGRASVIGNNVETRFLDPKDLQLPKYQDRLPFTYEYSGESVPETESNLLNFPYLDIEESVFEWVDKDFEEIEEGLGLLNTCLESILSSRQLSDDEGPPKESGSIQQGDNDGHDQLDESYPDKVEAQHRIITLNELEEHELSLEDMNQNLAAHKLDDI